MTIARLQSAGLEPDRGSVALGETGGVRCPTALRGCLLALLEAAPGLVMVSNARGRMLYMNTMGRLILGIGLSSKIVARKVSEFYSAQAYERFLEEGIPACLRAGVWRGETTFIDRDGAEIPVSQVLMAHRIKEQDGREMTMFSSIAWDISEHKRIERRLRHQATHDTLTGLPNRVLLMDRLTQALRSAERHRRLVGVVFLDLDGFKKINDEHGHEQANLVLSEVAQRLRAGIRAEDTVARYGGDEFVLLIPDLDARNGIARVTSQIRKILDDPFLIGARSIRISASIGSAIYPEDGDDIATLLRKADFMMYDTKKRMSNGARVGGASMSLRHVDGASIVLDLPP